MATGRIKREIKIDPLPPRLGRIKVGKKAVSSSGKEIPTATDYFSATGKYAGLFEEVYGREPKTIQVYFPSEDENLVCREEYVYRDNAGKKVATGDGEEFEVWSEKVGRRVRVSISDVPNVMEMVSQKFPSKTGWQISLTLNVVIPRISKIYGVWTFETKGKASTIPQITECFDSMKAREGRISGILCDLNVEFAKSDSPRASRFPVVSLVPNETEQAMANLKDIKRITE